MKPLFSSAIAAVSFMRFANVKNRIAIMSDEIVPESISNNNICWPGGFAEVKINATSVCATIDKTDITIASFPRCNISHCVVSVRKRPLPMRPNKVWARQSAYIKTRAGRDATAPASISIASLGRLTIPGMPRCKTAMASAGCATRNKRYPPINKIANRQIHSP
jgi:hypothetical protein